MPPSLLIALRGDPTYAAAIDQLLAAVQAEGLAIESRHQLAEHALAELASKHNVTLPPRGKPHGTNRYGSPKSQRQRPARPLVS